MVQADRYQYRTLGLINEKYVKIVGPNNQSNNLLVADPFYLAIKMSMIINHAEYN